MPHECTSCGLTFPDGSKEMLSGCPDCGGNKFQFHPGETSSDGTPSSPSTGADAPGDQPPRSSSPSDPTDSSFTLGSLRSEEPGPDAGSGPSEPSPGRETTESIDPTGDDASPDTEDPAQTSARSTVTSSDELHTSDSGRSSRPDPDPSRTASGAADENTVTSEPTDNTVPASDTEDTDTGTTGEVPEPPDDSDPPDISELREELNEQFESIKIHARGEYELNLMELYDREEHIIALQEDGRYVIDVPSSWREADEEA